MKAKTKLKANSKSSGFTLIEIMVAVAVLALSGVALLGNIGQATRDLATISDKAFKKTFLIRLMKKKRLLMPVESGVLS